MAKLGRQLGPPLPSDSGANDYKQWSWERRKLEHHCVESAEASLLDPPMLERRSEKSSIHLCWGSQLSSEETYNHNLHLFDPKALLSKRGNMGPGEILLNDREFPGHKTKETISIIFYLILYTFPNSL